MKIELFVENPIQTNCWVLIDEDSKDAIIIDLGGGYKKIFEYIKKQGGTLKYILCTHGHFDHVMGVAEMQQDGVDIPVYMNEKDYYLTKNINDMYEMFTGQRGSFAPIKIAKFIDENTELKIGKHKIQIIETPGHTKGGMCFLIDQFLFSGDSLFCENIGRCDLEGGNYETLIKSLKEKILPLSEEIEVFPGHDTSTTMKHEKAYNPYLK